LLPQLVSRSAPERGLPRLERELDGLGARERHHAHLARQRVLRDHGEEPAFPLIGLRECVVVERGHRSMCYRRRPASSKERGGSADTPMIRAELAFATPRKLPKAASVSGRVVVVDVAFASEASGGGFEKITKPFIDGLGARLAAWVDHHD